jgi:DNA-directed RNA polymerase subunit omega
MIEALKDDKTIHKVGGRFKFTSLVQHRVRELMEGARPLVERNGRSDLEVAVQEIVEDKIAFELPPAEELKWVEQE